MKLNGKSRIGSVCKPLLARGNTLLVPKTLSSETVKVGKCQDSQPPACWFRFAKDSSADSSTPKPSDPIDIEEIGSSTSVPLRAPWTVAKKAHLWEQQHPAQLGRFDTLTLEIRGGANEAVELSRNDSSEFYSDSSLGSHDCDHPLFESIWEQLGGQPMLVTSPMNEFLVNSFEWVLAPHWREPRRNEMKQAGLDPANESSFPELETQEAEVGVRLGLRNTLLQQGWAKTLFHCTGRDVASFPNSQELDWLLRAATGDSRSLHQNMADFKQFCRLGVQLATMVGEECPTLVDAVNELSSQAQRVKEQGGEGHVECLPVPWTNSLRSRTRPVVQEMNRILEKLPPAYVQGLQPPSGPQSRKLHA